LLLLSRIGILQMINLYLEGVVYARLVLSSIKKTVTR
jgi:hypothetical protein